ncbi:MAG: hypothetical protein JNL25_05650 [Rhodospirillaceae bacterium]|nr:hypothetical protein [Rhodospirillaceae bacterium]
MTLPPLENLVKSGQLKLEKPNQAEFDGLLKSGSARLNDAGKDSLSPESRFDLAYNAAHALSLAALRWHGYRPDNRRYIVFQALQHTLGMPPEQWRILDKAHGNRNLAEYDGQVEVDAQLLVELIKVAHTLRAKVAGLGPVPPKTP